MASLPSLAAKRTRIITIPPPCCTQQIRYATLLKRPHRPYTFTQLVTLSDGSTYTARTTSPKPIFRSTKDTRNHPMWQPSLDALRNVEQDEAGRLRAFRTRFGRGWDLDSQEEEEGPGMEGRGEAGGGESLMDLISGAGGGSGYGEKAEGKAEESNVDGVEMIKILKDGKLVSVAKQSKKKERRN